MARARHRLAHALGLLLFLAIAAAAKGEEAPENVSGKHSPSAHSLLPVILGVVINGQEEGTTLLLRVGNALYVRPSDLAHWRIRPFAATPKIQGGQQYLPLAALPGVAVTIDEMKQTVRVTIPPELFEANALVAGGAAAPPLSPGVFAAFLNYDLVAEHSDFDDRLGGFFETAVSDDWGLVTSTFLTEQSSFESRIVRLDTTYIRDDPGNLTRLTLGDSITRGSDWANPIRFAGVRYGTDFGLQPNFISFPTPAFAGRTTLPSTVEVFVNDALRFSGKVDQGPFSIAQVPVVTGSGELRYVIQDAAGVERAVTMPYYVSSRVLRSGLQDFSYEAGIERKDYGLGSFDYGQPFASGTYRYGLSDAVTAEGHAEVGLHGQVAGGGLAWVWAPIGEFSLAAAGSTSDRGEGALAEASFAHIDRWWSVSLSHQQATRGFRQLGIDNPAQQIRARTQASGGLSLGRYGGISLAYAALGYADGGSVDALSANYSLSLSEAAFLNAFALTSESNGSDRSLTVGFTLTIPLGNQRSASALVQQQDGRLNAAAEYRQNAPSGTGIGYRLQAGYGDLNHLEGDFTWRTGFGSFEADVVDDAGHTAGRLLASGGLAYVAGQKFVSRHIDDGFGAVSVPGYANVRIYQENQLLARTNAAGIAVIPDLRAYEENHLRIETSDLPLDAKLGGETLTVVPRYRGAVLAEFPVTKTRTASVVIQLPDGTLLPPGLSLTIDGKPDAAFSGYGGVVFVTGVRSGLSLEAQWSQGHCRAVLERVPAEGVLPRLGPLICRPLEP